jgi:hypothetical protein
MSTSKTAVTTGPPAGSESLCTLARRGHNLILISAT